MSSKRALLLLIIAIFLQGCQTLRMPQGPDVSQLSYIAGAPTIGIQVIDSRPTERIGIVGADSMFVKKQEAIPSTQNYLFKFLHDQGINAVFVPQTVNSSELKVDAILKTEITKINVSSFDLLLDEPKYVSEIRVTLQNLKGETLFKNAFRGEHNSRAITDRGTGEIVAKTINKAIQSLSISSEFMMKIKGLKQGA